MEILVYGAICALGAERECAYQLLALALKNERGMALLPRIERGKCGKPFFPEFSDIHFNISHSHGAAVVALHDKSIGIDVEKLRAAPKRLSEGLEDREFFCRWTQKEATVKKQGKSIAEILRREIEKDPFCRTFEDILPGWIVTVCPSEACSIRFEVIGEGQW